jgi:hypothetical protein
MTALFLRVAAVVLGCVLTGCNAKTSTAAAASPRATQAAATPAARLGVSAPPEITGTEKIGWDHELLPTTRLSDYQYSIYVDDVLTRLSGVTCTMKEKSDLIAECSARLPPLPEGQHSLRVVVIRVNGPTPTASHPSRPLPVTVTPPKGPS